MKKFNVTVNGTCLLYTSYWAIFVERRLFLSLLVVPLILYFYEGEVASRLWSIFQGHDTSSDLRWALWDSTMYIVRENPIFGIGWNTFYLVYPEYNYYICLLYTSM